MLTVGLLKVIKLPANRTYRYILKYEIVLTLPSIVSTINRCLESGFNKNNTYICHA